MRRFSIAVVVFFLIVMLFPAVNAASIGVNKAVINFDNVLKDGYAQEVIVVSTSFPTDIGLDYEFDGDIAEWMRIEPSNETIVMNSNRPAFITVIVEPPADAQIRDYNGRLLLSTGDITNITGQMGAAVRVAFEVRINVRLTGTQIVDCVVGGLDITDTEINDPIGFYATVHNTGNVRLSPDFVLDVWDQYQTRVVKTYEFTVDDEILPTVRKRVFHELEMGQDP
jgi:hypothetical protein